MRGPRGAREMLHAFLVEKLPDYVALRRDEWNLDESDLPLPEHIQFMISDPLALDRWPLIAIAVTRGSRVRRIEDDSYNGDTTYNFTYAARVFVYVREAGQQRAVDVRDDLTTLVQMLLLDYQVVDEDQTGLIEETTMSVDYTEPMPVKGDRFVAAAYLSFEIRVEEVLQRTDRAHGSVATVDVDGYVYGPAHPALL